jgi:hypothetical protein
MLSVAAASAVDLYEASRELDAGARLADGRTAH